VNNRATAIDSCILKNTVQYIFRYGFSSLTMEKAAEYAGISKRTLYKRYQNKDALLDAVMEFQVGRIAALFSSVADDEKLDGVTKISTLLSLIAELSRRIPLVLMRDVMNNDRRYWEKLQRIRHERILTDIDRVIRRSREEGIIRSDIDPALISTLLIASIEAIATPFFLTRLPFEISDAVSGITNMLFQGILSDSGRERLSKTTPVSYIQALEAIL
jgi:AcrR family transcriptional regulator